MKRTALRFGVLVSASALVLTGCGRDDDGDNGADGDGATGPGVTSEPCPDAVDEEKGCIYLGVISDLTGPFAPVGVPLTAGGEAFWAKVNADGGIGDYEINVTENVRDNQYSPDVHARVFNEIKGDVLAMSQSLGTVATEAMLRDPDAEELVVLPATLGSNWIFEDRVIEVGTSYCAEAMNAVDYGIDELGATGVAAIHFEGDYGDDGAGGARIAAEARGVPFTSIVIAPGGDPAPVVAQLLRSEADLVVMSTAPTELAQVVGGAAQAGFQGRFIGSIPTWNKALLGTPAAPALEALYLWASPFPGWDADTPGHEAMREAAGDADPNEYYALGWTGGYLMKAALEAAVEADDLTRAGLLEAATSLTGVEGEGMLPPGSGNYAGDPNEAAVRSTYILEPNAEGSSGATVLEDAFVGPTAEAYEFEQACYLD